MIAIVGGGICGLALALNLHRRGLGCVVFERAPEVKELGVGITLLPHAMRELTSLGMGGELRQAGIENVDSRFFNRFGQLIYREPRGTAAGYPFPEVGIHRGTLHRILHDAVLDRLAADALLAGRECVGIDQDRAGVAVRCRDTSTGAPLPPVRPAAAVACDGIRSVVRRSLKPILPRRSRHTRICGEKRRRASSGPTAIILQTSSTSGSRNWSVTGRLAIWTGTSLRTSSGACRTDTRRSPGSPSMTWPADGAVGGRIPPWCMVVTS
jgi:2-polyprenyl-6-methoxyphenol hydroxylase-like FAD-dependent oxidoreductase